MTSNAFEILRFNIKKYRKEKGFTQETLSEMVDISRDYLSNIERGKYTPSFKTIVALAEALEIEPHLLLKK